MKYDVPFSTLLGKTLTAVEGKVGDDMILFHVGDGTKYALLHRQDCCETVTIEDICGDLASLVGSPILQAEANSNENENPPGVTREFQDSFTWTFYRLATVKGLVVIRWYGESNGYYSESVDFCKL